MAGVWMVPKPGPASPHSSPGEQELFLPSLRSLPMFLNKSSQHNVKGNIRGRLERRIMLLASVGWLWGGTQMSLRILLEAVLMVAFPPLCSPCLFGIYCFTSPVPVCRAILGQQEAVYFPTWISFFGLLGLCLQSRRLKSSRDLGCAHIGVPHKVLSAIEGESHFLKDPACMWVSNETWRNQFVETGSQARQGTGS